MINGLLILKIENLLIKHVRPLNPSPNSNPYILEARLYVNKYWTDHFGDDELLIYPITFDEFKKC